MIHGDVFRFPHHVSLLSSILGVGAQLFALVVSFFVLGGMGVFYAGHRGHAHVAILVLYALSFPLALFVAITTYVLSFIPNLGPMVASLLPLPICLLDVSVSPLSWLLPLH